MSESRLPDQAKSWLSTLSADLHRAIDSELDGLRSSVEQRITAVHQAFDASRAQVGQVVLNIETVSQELAQTAAASARRESEAAAQAQLESVRAQLASQLESDRSEFETVRTSLESQLANAECDVATMRQKRDEHAAKLEEARARVAELEELHRQSTLLSELAEARLAEEVQRRVATEKQLEASRHELLLVRAEAESRRLEARVQDVRTRPSHGPAPSGSNLHDTFVALKDGVHALSSVRRDELLSSLLEQLSCHFVSAAIFAATPQGIRLWKARASDSSMPPEVPGAHADDDSPLSRAFRERSPVHLHITGPDQVLGLWKKAIRHALALPITAQGRLLAVVYVENPWDHATHEPEMLDVVAEILVDCVNRHLNSGSSDGATEPSTAHELEFRAPTDSKDSATTARADPQAFAVSRQASRLKVNGPADVLIDGMASTLVDISTLGAQVLSPTTLRPNRSIRMVLQNGTGAFTCGARVVWARLESPNSVTGAQFRAGVQFVDIHRVAIEAFIARHRQAGPVAQHAAQ